MTVHIPDPAAGWTDIGAVTGGGVDLDEGLDVMFEPVEPGTSGWNIEVTVGSPERPPATSTEPCECCGQPVQLIAILPFLQAILGPDPVPDGMRRRTENPQWQEVHHDSRPGSYRVLYRPHTPERCTRARAGDPEPADFDEED